MNRTMGIKIEINPVVDDDVVEKIEMRLSRLAAMTEGRQQDTDGVFEAFKERQNLIDTRMRHRDEAVEAMGESLTTLYLKVDQLNSGVKEHDARLTLFLGTTGEINKELQVLQHQMATNTDRNERRITALENGMDKYVPLQVIERLENLEKRPKRTVLKTASGSRWGMNTATAHPPEKKSEKPRKEYKKVMKKGASVG